METTKPRPTAKARTRRERALRDYPMLRTSERVTFKTCQFRWWLTYGKGMRAKTSAPALRFGSLIHEALAGWYIPGPKRGVHPAKTFNKAYTRELKEAAKIGFRDEDEQWVDAAELGPAMLEHYVDFYGQDSRWEVLVTEFAFEYLVMHPNCAICDERILQAEGDYEEECSPNCPGPKKYPWFNYVGVLDGVWRDRHERKLWIPDHKSTSGIGPSTVKHLPLDDQAGAYWSFGVRALREAGMLRENQQLSGMLYNFLRKSMPDERPQDAEGRYLNKDGSVSKQQPSPYFLRQPIYRDEYDRNQHEMRSMDEFRIMQMVRDEEIPLTKTPGAINCPGCPVYDICELHETGHDWQEMMKSVLRPWDPYAAHEVYAGR